VTGPPVGAGVGIQDETGDHPLTTSFTMRGRIGVTAAALPYNNVPDPSGTFSVSSIPAGSTIVKALLYLTDWVTGPSASATFAGTPFGPSAPLTTDPVGNLVLGVFRFDVTAQVTGNGSYAYTSSGISESYGSALVVVYRNDALRGNKVWINDGAEAICCGATSTTQYTGGPRRPRTGRLIVFTQADDDLPGDSGEVISFNGNAVGGPIDANLGPYASLFDLAVSGLARTNTVAINTPNDFFGWHLSILAKRNQ
jgi:hypothetical protein